MFTHTWRPVHYEAGVIEGPGYCTGDSFDWLISDDLRYQLVTAVMVTAILINKMI